MLNVMTKIKRTYHLTNDSIDKIEQLAKEKNISYAAAIELMIKHYFEDRSEEHKLLKDTISSLLDEKFLSMTDDLEEIDVVLVNLQKEINLFNENLVYQIKIEKGV